MENKFYVYEHIRNDTGLPCYIGKGSGNRAFQLIKRNKYHQAIINKIGITVNIICDKLSENQAFRLEENCITVLRGLEKKISNLTNGGEGRSGYKLTPEQAKKHKMSLKGRVSPMKNKIPTQKHKDKISKSSKNKIINYLTNPTKIIDCKTGQIFNSIKEAAICYNINYNTLLGYLQGRHTNKTNLKYLK